MILRAWAFWGLAAAVIALDQWTKQLVVERMQLHESIPLLPGALHLTYVHNTGTAFGLFSGGGRFLVAVAVAAALFITGYWVFLRRREPPPSPWLLAGLALPLGGAIGNLIDRLRYGYVIDFVDFRVWPVFNVADSAITIGAILIAACFLLTPQPRKEPVPVEAEAASPPADDRAPGAPAAAAPAIQSESS